MATPRGLGRGLGSLIPKMTPPVRPSSVVGGQATDNERQTTNDQRPTPEATSVASAAGIPLSVAIERVLPNPEQPREHFGHAELEELIGSVKTHGILQPLVVTERGDGTFELIAGERRLRAARLAGLLTVPVILRDAKEQEKLELALIENIQRQDLNPVEEARAYRRLAEEYDLSQDQIAERVGKSRSQVANTVRLLDLPMEIQEALKSGALAPSAARSLLAIDGADAQLSWWKRLATEHLTVRDIEEAARRTRGTRTFPLPDANTEAEEKALREALGTKARVKKRGEQGAIELSFFSSEEYRALFDRLTRGA